MKIAIITLPLHTNYGGILQAYALQTVLQRMGHDVQHLQPKVEFPPLHPAWQMPFVWVKRLIRKCFLGEWRLPVFEHPHRWIRRYTDVFIYKYIEMRSLSDEEWNASLAKDYDVFIVGSDQVWRPCYALPIERYFLSFLDDTCSNPRIAYAASFGTENCEFSSKQILSCRKLLQKFSFVSVREQSGVEICNQLFGVQASHLLDPTLLLSKADYLKLIQNQSPSKGNLMVYILDETPDIQVLISQIAASEKLVPFNTNYSLGNRLGIPQLPLENWLRGFVDAKLIITDSFHACVFAIIFNKPFICIGNNERGMSRFHSLLDLFGLQHCLLNEKQSFEIPDINWVQINVQLKKLRNQSLTCIKQVLEI